jgi:hypothetical protein
MLKPFIQKNDTRWRGAIPATKTLEVAIHRLAFGGVVRRTRSHLGIGASTSSKYTHKICEVLVYNFYDNISKFPKDKNYRQLWMALKKSRTFHICGGN